jgi:uncharacterized protein DUF5681
MADAGEGAAAAPFANGRETVAAGRRAAGGRFAPGNPGGPGRPRGARHAALAALDAIGAEAAEAVLRRVAEDAQAGDLRAAEILLRRLWPERKGRPVEIALPEVASAADLVPALGAVIGAIDRGELTPEEAQAICGVLESQRRAIETAGLEARVAALEECVPGVSAGAGR